MAQWSKFARGHLPQRLTITHRTPLFNALRNRTPKPSSSLTVSVPLRWSHGSTTPTVSTHCDTRTGLFVLSTHCVLQSLRLSGAVFLVRKQETLWQMFSLETITQGIVFPPLPLIACPSDILVLVVVSHTPSERLPGITPLRSSTTPTPKFPLSLTQKGCSSTTVTSTRITSSRGSNSDSDCRTPLSPMPT